jgi:uncharacterized protein (DUF2062 family)
MSPGLLARALAAGLVCGLFPSLGATTMLCVLVGAVFGLNQIALQTANYLAYPLQLLLLIPFFQGGAALFGIEVPVDSASDVVSLAEEDPWGAIVLLWDVSWRAMILWALLAVPTTLVLSAILLPLIRPIAERLQPETSANLSQDDPHTEA